MTKTQQSSLVDAVSATVDAWLEGTARSSLGADEQAEALAKGVGLLALDVALAAAGCHAGHDGARVKQLVGELEQLGVVTSEGEARRLLGMEAS